jgi:hypothetical protein
MSDPAGKARPRGRPVLTGRRFRARAARRHKRRVPFPCVLCAAVVGLLPWLGGCAPPSPPGPYTASGREEPYLFAGQPQRWDPIRIGLHEPVNPAHAPVPRNDGERLVFRQLYETMVRIAASGQLRPALASGWRRDDARTWTFRLRSGATFSDGTPLRAQDVRAAWVSAHARALARGESHPWDWIESLPWPEEGQGETFSVTLSKEVEDLPAIFAHPALAVAKPRAGLAWPLGSGPYRIDPEPDADLVLVPAQRDDRPRVWPHRAEIRRSALHFIVDPERDPRDLLSGDIDLLLVRDRTVLALCDELPAYARRPLPWDRLYLFLAPAVCPDALLYSSDPLPRGSLRREPRVSEALRRELAEEVMLSEARAASSFAWMGGDTLYNWADAEAETRMRRPGGAGTPPAVYWEGRRLPFWTRSPAVAAGDPPRVLYPAGDGDAARIAGRLAVLLPWDHGRLIDRYGEEFASLRQRLRPEAGAPAPIAPAVQPQAFTELLVRGEELGYVCAIDRVYHGAWEHDCAFPLAATRPHLIVRRGLVQIGLDWDGGLRFEAAGWQDAGDRP